LAEGFPWLQLMRLGIGTYHLSPREFWNCTLRELVFTRGVEGMTRAGLDEMMRAWPD
jgi:uncharacterized phage protein (TIGR02216 family)